MSLIAVKKTVIKLFTLTGLYGAFYYFLFKHRRQRAEATYMPVKLVQ